jgi:serine/threonine protein kinase
MNSRRKPDLYIYSELTNYTVEVNYQYSKYDEDSLTIISYDKEPGNHAPSFVGHMVQVVQKVAQLHQSKVIHGDLRFSNIVFSDSKADVIKSTIIDFDYSRTFDTTNSVYPPNFNRDIDDGYRHDNVAGGAPLMYEHDIAAIQWMCKQYCPIDESIQEVWNLRVNSLTDPDGVDQFINALSQYEKVMLQHVNESTVENQETGSL